jgi:WD40 repeat protein
MDTNEQLAEWLVRWEEATDQGRGTILEDLCRDAPTLLPEFRALLQRLGPVNAVLAGAGLGNVSHEELAGRIEAGRYRPVSFHAQGGLGLIFTAEDTELRRTVALKAMQSLPALDPASRQRFLLEAEITAMLEHPGVVPVHGMGLDASGRPYYAMRFVRGHTLGETIEQHHRSDPNGASTAERNVEFRRLLTAFIAVCEAVAYAHSRGVIHRDLKPDNIMLGPYGEVLVLDWGLARSTAASGPDQKNLEAGSALPDPRRTDHTVQGRAKGTWAYMSPEQARGDWDRVGPASDIYSLGATLYILLTGKKPYEGRSAQEVAERVKAADFVPPRRNNPAVSRALEAVCIKAMAPRPEDRYPDASELARDLERWLAGEAVSAWREPLRVRARRWLRRHRTLMTAAAAAVLVALLGLGALTVQQHRANEQLDARNKKLKEANEREEGLRADVETRRDAALRHLYVANLTLIPQAREEGQGERVQELLREVIPQRGEKDLRGFEWRYFSRLGQADRRTLSGHGDWVQGVAWSRDGRWLGSAGYDKTARVWDAKTGQEVHKFSHPDRLNAVAFSPDSNRLACACWDRTVVVWDLESDKKVLTLRGHGHAITGVRFSPNGRTIASASHDRTVRVWDAVIGAQVFALPEFPLSVNDVAFSPDGLLLASASGERDERANGDVRGDLRIWDAKTGQQKRSLRGHRSDVVSVCFQPGGTLLASAGSDRTVRLWNTKTGQEVLARALSSLPRRMAFSPDGLTLAIACWDQTVKLVDATTGERFSTLVGHTAFVNGLAFSPDGKQLVSGGADRLLKVWNLALAEESVTLVHKRFSLNVVAAVAFSPDSRHLAAADNSGQIKLWNNQTRREARSLRGHQSAVHGLCFAPDGKALASAGSDRTVRIWDLATGREVHNLKGHNNTVYGVGFSPDGSLLASAGDETVRLWDTRTGKELKVLTGHTGFVFAVAFSPNGRHVASGSKDGTVRIWDLQSGQEIHCLRIRPELVFSVAYNHDGTRLASGSGTEDGPGEVKVWDVATGKTVLTLRRFSTDVRGVCYSPDGRRLAAVAGNLIRESNSGQVKLWDLVTGNEVLSFKDNLRVWSVAFSPDGQRLAVGCAGGIVKMWEASPSVP